MSKRSSKKDVRKLERLLESFPKYSGEFHIKAGDVKFYRANFTWVDLPELEAEGLIELENFEGGFKQLTILQHTDPQFRQTMSIPIRPSFSAIPSDGWGLELEFDEEGAIIDTIERNPTMFKYIVVVKG